MDSFTFIGTLSNPKETEKFHPFERQTYQSGWTITTLLMRCHYGDSNVMLRLSGGKWADDSKNIVKTLKEKAEGDKKYPKQDIEWSKRFDSEAIKSVPFFKRFVFDPVRASVKQDLRNLISQLKNGETETDLMKKYNVSDLNQAEDMLKKLYAKKKEFLVEHDFVEYLGTCVDWDKYKNSVFKITGTYESSYNANDQKFYTNYHVTSIHRVEDDEKQLGQLKANVYVGKDSFDTMDYDEDGCARINGWTSYYDAQEKKNGFRPIMISVYGNAALINRFQYLFDNVPAEIVSTQLVCDIVNGTQYREATLDDLDDETKEDIKFGLTTLESQRQRMGRVAGSTISEFRFVDKLTIFQKTDYLEESMCPASGNAQQTSDDMDDGDLPFDLD
ncbi:MAG TPA: hypothetical protein DCW90_09435 [Lachnospiraceae bacterium]|nr:hypothetical protein [Lachnospiraceae bacterium]